VLLVHGVLKSAKPVTDAILQQEFCSISSGDQSYVFSSHGEATSYDRP
jgi:hypothetical protein